MLFLKYFLVVFSVFCLSDSISKSCKNMFSVTLAKQSFAKRYEKSCKNNEYTQFTSRKRYIEAALFGFIRYTQH